jgi:perosamine synthetase
MAAHRGTERRGLRMTNPGAERFLFPAEPWPCWEDLVYRPRPGRLEGLPSASLCYLFFWARNAIFHSLAALRIQRGDTVLIPAYICAAAVEPIEAFGAEVRFYEISKNCVPDFADLIGKINAKTRAVLAVNYFGFPCGTAEVREICDKHGLRLIEDCAHVLRGECNGRLLGTFGDASVFSWRKFFPLFDGGELVLNRPQRQLSLNWHRERLLFSLRVAKNLWERVFAPKSEAAALNYKPNFDESPAETSAAPAAPLSRKSIENHLLHIQPNSTTFDELMVNFPISRLSRLLLNHSDVAHVVARRRANYAYLQRHLSLLNGIRPLFDDLPAGVCPWVFPVFFEGMANVQFALRSMGIPAASWSWVRHPGVEASQFPSAHFLYENLVFLPIHQNLQTEELDLVVKAAKTTREQSNPEKQATRTPTNA